MISNLPAAPSRQDDPADFVDKADAFIAALPTLVTQLNTFLAELTALASGTALSIPYTFSTTTTDADPGNGYLRLDNATQNSATTIRADLVGSDSTTWTSVLDTFDDSTSTIKGFIMLQKVTDPTKWSVFSVSALASPSGYKNITVANVASSGANPFSNNDSIVLKFTRTGDKGDTGTVAGTASGAINMADQEFTRALFKDCAYVFVDKGNSGTSTQTLDYTAGQHQKITATGNHTIATSNWPPTANLGEMLLELVNGGAFTITWPTINWIKPDGTTTTSISTYLATGTERIALQTSGTDFVFLWSRDAGSTIYGKLV